MHGLQFNCFLFTCTDGPSEELVQSLFDREDASEESDDYEAATEVDENDEIANDEGLQVDSFNYNCDHCSLIL